MQDPPTTGKPRLLLLGLGALMGLVLATSGLVERWSGGDDALPEFAIARVGDTYIPRSRYIELLSDLETDKRTPLTAEDRQFVLGRLVDEELLILRGMELGLPASAPAIRKAIAAAVIAQVATESDATPPDEAALRELYESDPQFFATTDRYQLRWWRLPVPALSPALKDKFKAGYPGATVTAEELERTDGWKRETIFPEQMLPLSKIADYLGPELAQAVPRLEPGHYSPAIEADGNLNILFLVEHQAGQLPPFDQLRPVLEAEYHRRAGDKALRDYLAWLRERTPIAVGPDVAD